MDRFHDPVLLFCAQECERQGAGPMAVYNMVLANKTMWYSNTITKDLIIRLGALVEPEKNAGGFRNVPVVFANGNSGLSHHLINGAMDTLVGIIHDPLWTALDIYKEFQRIHPFVDGNGRVGAILFNALNGTLHEPTAPPKID